MERGGELASVWNAMGIGFLCVVVCAVAVLLVVSTGLFDPGSVVEFNDADAVYYFDEATEDDARFLGEALTQYEIFGGTEGVPVEIKALSDEYTISFFLVEKLWEEPDEIAYFRELGELLADGRFGRPLDNRIVRFELRTPGNSADRVKQCRLRRGVSRTIRSSAHLTLNSSGRHRRFEKGRDTANLQRLRQRHRGAAAHFNVIRTRA